MEICDKQIRDFDEFEENMNELIDDKCVTRLERGLIQVTILSEPFNRYLSRNKLSVTASKLSCNHILLTYLLANTVRLLWCLTLPDDHPLLIHFGDFTQWFGGRRIYFLLPFILININVSYQSLIYSMSNERDFIWIKVFASLRGESKPVRLGISVTSVCLCIRSDPAVRGGSVEAIDVHQSLRWH